MIAAFAFQRDVQPQLGHQRFRPDAGGQHDIVTGHAALGRLYPGNRAAGQVEILDLGLQDRAAALVGAFGVWLPRLVFRDVKKLVVAAKQEESV